MREPDRLYAESVSNNFLEGPLLLTPADEEILSEAGWRPPTATWNPANWWTELSPEADHTDYTLLADMMVTALRDVQGVRRPASLVYESFHRHGTGLIELTGFGIETADRQRITESRPAPVPVPLPAPARPSNSASNGDFEGRLSEAKQRGDHVRYFDLLLAADLVLPATGPAVEDPGLSEYATTLRDGSTHVLAFTSPQAMSQSLGAHAGLHRRSTFVALAGSWPNPAWCLTVNTGLPSEISLDAAMIARLNTMHRSSAETTMVDSLVLPPVPPLPADPGLPHSAPELQYGPPEAAYAPAEPPFTPNGTPLYSAEPPLGTSFVPNESPLAPRNGQPIPAEPPPAANGAAFARNERPLAPPNDQPPVMVNGTSLGPVEAPPATNGTPLARDEPPLAPNGSRPPVNGTPHGPVEAPPATNGTPLVPSEPPLAPPDDRTPATVNGAPHGPVEAPPATNGTPLTSVEAPFSADGAPPAQTERSAAPGGPDAVAGEPAINGARFVPVDKPVAAAGAQFDPVAELIRLQTMGLGSTAEEPVVRAEGSAPVPLVSTAPALPGQAIRAPHGTGLFSLDDTGAEALLAVYDGASGRWAGDAKVAADGYGRD
jgi:hypothetical protein